MYRSPSIVWVDECFVVTGHVGWVRQTMWTELWWGSLLEDWRRDMNIQLKWIFGK